MDDRIAKNFVLVVAISAIIFVWQGSDPATVTLERLLAALAFAAVAAVVLYLRYDRKRPR